MTEIKDEVKKLSEYQVPQDLSAIKLNQNESPVDIPYPIKEKIFRQLSSTPWNRYPDFYAGRLLETIAEYTDIGKNRLLAGNSSNELIQTIIYALCQRGDTIVTVTPGFSVYKRVADIMGIQTVEIPLGKNFKFDPEAILKGAGDAKVIMLASPNNPTGTILENDDIQYLASRFKGTLVLDEAYFEFSGQTAQQYLDTYDNLLIVRTFSKALSLAAARLGYMMGPESVIREMQKAKLPYSLGIFQQIAGEVLIRNRAVIDRMVTDIIIQRKRVFSFLESIPALSPIPSQANFILFHTGDITAGEMFRNLYENGILVRYFDSPVLKNWLRAAVGTPEENDRFISVITGMTERSS